LRRLGAGQNPLTIAVFQSEGYLPDYVAKDKGFGEKYGLDINFVTPASGSAAAQLLLAGGVQGWSTDPLIILTAASRGYDIKIAGISAPTFTYTILVSKEGNWPAETAPLTDKLKALKGKRIGVSGIGAGTDNALIMLLKTAGLGVEDVTRVAIGQQQAAIGQLSAGRIDAFVSFSLAGNAVIEEQAGARNYISTLNPEVPEQVRQIPHLGFAVSGEYASKNPKAVQGWLNAERDAIAWIRANPTEAAAILNKYVFNNQQAELAKKIVPQALDSFFKYTRDDFKLPPDRFELVVQEGRDVGAFKDTKEPTYDAVVLSSAQMPK
jgi:ABC-type nitrate/sulfonate/bicarbonate transport system substrate-binding protein